MSNSVRQLHKEQTKALLLQTAYDVFSQKGILGTRMSDVAQAAGVSHGTVFLHFKTQEALITEVTEFYGGKIALRTHELADTCAGLRELLSAHLAAIGEFEPFYTRLVAERPRLPSDAQDVLLGLQSAVSFHFSQAAKREFADGSHRDIPESFLFNLWIGLIHHYLLNKELFAPKGSVVQNCGNALIENFMKLLKTEEIR